MTIDLFIGTWLLMGSVSYRSELEIIDGRRDPMGVLNWLNGKGDNSISEIIPAKGLTLTIAESGSFQEEKTGEPEIKWFNASGELSKVQTFSGKVSFHRSRAYLIANNIPDWAKPYGKVNKAKLRYDDGDTKITDLLEIRDKKLVRTINVVTDEMFFDRVIIVYQKDKS